MKLDKDTLKKQHYWIGLAFLPLLVLVMIIFLMMGSSEAATEEAKIKGKEKDLKSKNQFKNQKEVDLLEEKNLEIAAQKNKVWEAAWNAQKDLFVWPQEMASLNTVPYGTNVDPIDLKYYSLYPQPHVHLKQYQDMTEMAKPSQFLGGPSGWMAVLDPAVFDLSRGELTSPDLWIEQENVWVKRSLLRIIQDANDTVRVFAPEDVDPKTLKDLPRGAIARSFKSPFWRLDLRLNGATLTSTLTNIGPRARSTNVAFKIQTQEGAPARTEIKAEGTPLAPGASKALPTVTVVGVSRDLYAVEQVLDRYSVPIKEIDEIDLTWPGQRYSSRTLKFHKAFKDIIDAASGGMAGAPGAAPGAPGAAPGAPGAPGAGAGAPKGRMGGRLMDDDGAGMMGSTANSGFATKQGLPYYRYFDVSDQVRRMSVALVLIVDQNHIQDVLAAFSSAKEAPGTVIPGRPDTRLRMQPTQMHWHHVPDTVVWDEDLKNNPNLAQRGVGGFGGRRMAAGLEDVDGGGGGMPLGFNRTLGGGRTTTTAGTPFGQQEDRSNLVELVVYGIVSIYERYVPPETPQDGQPAAAAPGQQ
jgi:hypothetical protein